MHEPSFSGEVKNELARLWPPAACDRQAELAGLVRATGTLDLPGGGRLALLLQTDHAAVARKILKLVRRDWALSAQVLVERRARLRKNLSFHVRIPPQEGLRPLLTAAGILDAGGRIQDAVPAAVLTRGCCARAFLRGLFLGAGWVSDPGRAHHLELVCPSPALADGVGQVLFGLGLPVRVAQRKEELVLYFKEGEQVARFLALVGAHQHLLRYEDVRALKEMRNQLNREINAETANFQKTMAAAARQVESIRRLAARGLQTLPPSLRELAELRLAHPEASLAELGALCRPPVGKSGVNHRMRQLLRLAADLAPGRGGTSPGGPGLPG